MNWYLVVIIPSREICDLVDRYRKKYAKYTGYVIPPHITIYPPFLITSSQKEVIDALKESFFKTPVVKVKCDSVDFFESKNNNVAYFKPDKDSADLMKKFLIKTIKALKGKIKDVFEGHKYTLSEYSPHMTIAEKIPKRALSKVKKELSRFKGEIEFEVDSIYIYKQRSDSKIWEELTRIKFNQR
ncbi:2'-5' RNA ligase family protein [Patescibacteria group bacterium]|nr:2'-5' RNA ligase family protein [Patescibacteria group bacterium]